MGRVTGTWGRIDLFQEWVAFKAGIGWVLARPGWQIGTAGESLPACHLPACMACAPRWAIERLTSAEAQTPRCHVS